MRRVSDHAVTISFQNEDIALCGRQSIRYLNKELIINFMIAMAHGVILQSWNTIHLYFYHSLNRLKMTCFSRQTLLDLGRLRCLLSSLVCAILIQDVWSNFLRSLQPSRHHRCRDVSQISMRSSDSKLAITHKRDLRDSKLGAAFLLGVF